MLSRLLLALLVVAPVAAESSAAKLWTDLAAKREKIPMLHQEVDVTRTFHARGIAQSQSWKLTFDISHGAWRQKSTGGLDADLTIFDGQDLFSMEDGGEEYVRKRAAGNRSAPMPSPYPPPDSDWSKAVETGRVPCGIAGSRDQCVRIQLPATPWVRSQTAARVARMVWGVQELLVDLENGVLISRHIKEQAVQNERPYEFDTTYRVRSITYDSSPGSALFAVPVGMREVKELPQWNAASFRKRLVGNPAPLLTVRDLGGARLSLDSFKGKIVLLDFWATWCPPCRADAPALEALYRKYSARDLMIVGISVDENRPAVEKFLDEHPRTYPTVLTTENELPGPYRVNELPTYIVIDRSGAVTAAVDGDQGFQDLRKLLRKAGLDIDQ